MDDIAGELGAVPSQVALAWLLHRAANVLPIPGTTSVSHLEQNVGANRVRLSDEQFQCISAGGEGVADQ
ncbi:MAG TPA: aldo/keto reductase [Jiangellaceae bacterium]